MAVTWIKFCGCTSWDDVAASIEAGADAIGLIFASSPRRVSWDAAREIARRIPPTVELVAVFVDPSEEEINAVRLLFPGMTVQFSGKEPAEFVRRYGQRAIKAIGIDARSDPVDVADVCKLYADATILFDAQYAGVTGGTGKTFPWERVAPIARERPIVVAGGLTPENVTSCVRSVRPYGVDVRNGIETDDRKDPEKMRAFVQAVHEADET
jgi:phosphoribosylanthranilate isomerase